MNDTYTKDIIELGLEPPRKIQSYFTKDSILIRTIFSNFDDNFKQDLQLGYQFMEEEKESPNKTQLPLIQNCVGWVTETPSDIPESDWRISETKQYRETFIENLDCKTYLGVDKTKSKVPVTLTLATDESGDCRCILFTRNGLKLATGDKETLCSIRKTDMKIKYLANLADPDIKDVKFKLAKNQSELQKELISREENLTNRVYKFGIVVCKDGQVVDNDIFSNDSSSNEYREFLNLIGDIIELKGFPLYNGGLDVKNNLTGTKSLYTKYHDNEIMFHVSTMLPLTSGQQLERKRHIGNDICVVVFHEGNHSYNLSAIKSKFNHIVIVVQLDKSTNTYRVSVARKEGIETNILPPIPHQIEKSKIRDFLLTKLINANNASLGQSILAKENIIKREKFLNLIFVKYR